MEKFLGMFENVLEHRAGSAGAKILSDYFISDFISSEVNFVRPGSDLIRGKNVCAARA